jgi:hypothetical protein
MDLNLVQFVPNAFLCRLLEDHRLSTRGSTSYAVAQGRMGRARRMGTQFIIRVEDVLARYPALSNDDFPLEECVWVPEDGAPAPRIEPYRDDISAYLVEPRGVALGRLSREAQAARPPLPPEELIEALHERVHRDPDTPARAATAIRLGSTERAPAASEEVEESVEEVTEPAPPSAPSAPSAQDLTATILQSLQGQIAAMVASALDTSPKGE